MEEKAQAAKMVSILTAAKAVIADESKWCKGRLHDGERSCALGAVRLACGIETKASFTRAEAAEKHPNLFPAASALATPLGGPEEFRVPAFNDGVYTTHQDVMDLFDKAIEAQCKIVRGE